MKKALIIFLAGLISFSFVANAQEPGNNLGKSLSQLRYEFPDVWLYQTTKDGSLYVSGDVSEGIFNTFLMSPYTNKVIEEMLVVQSEDGFASEFFLKMKKTFLSKGGYSKYESPNKTSIRFYYSSFYVELDFSFQAEGYYMTQVVYSKKY